jgi:hypothetical protein
VLTDAQCILLEANVTRPNVHGVTQVVDVLANNRAVEGKPEPP